jgi:hypothetical protein
LFLHIYQKYNRRLIFIVTIVRFNILHMHIAIYADNSYQILLEALIRGLLMLLLMVSALNII